MMKTVLYLRVSTDSQTTENQRFELDQLMKDATKRKFDRVYPPNTNRLLPRLSSIFVRKSEPTAVEHKRPKKPDIRSCSAACSNAPYRASKSLVKSRRNKYIYMTCYDPKNPEKKLWIKESDVLEQVEKVFKSIQVPKENRYNQRPVRFYDQSTRRMPCAITLHPNSLTGSLKIYTQPLEMFGFTGYDSVSVIW